MIDLIVKTFQKLATMNSETSPQLNCHLMAATQTDATLMCPLYIIEIT